MPALRHYILATAGHVDHGKSTLVRALTGTDPDRLPEEKKRGLTIELGFAHLDMEDLGGEVLYRLGIVDVPGHEDFVHNMVGGVGSVDLALLAVAADDGWMQQTEEHLEILSYLGVPRGLVALTKCDLVEDNYARAREEEIQARLQDSTLAGSPIVHTSGMNDPGIRELMDAMRDLLRDAVPPPDKEKPRLSVDRVFSVVGAGTVVTGTLTGGQLQKEQLVCVQPGGTETRIRSIQAYNQAVDSVTPGTRTALNLAGLTPGKDIRRGDVISLPALGMETDTLDTCVHTALRVLEMEKAHVRPLQDGTRIRFHHGSGNVPATIRFPTIEELLPGESAPAQLRLESPVLAFAGDRFIIRDWQEQLTMAGGTIIDPHATRHRIRSLQRREFLQSIMEDATDVSTYVEALLCRDGLVKTSDLLVQSHFSRLAIDACIAQMVTEGKLVERQGWGVALTRWNHWLEEASRRINSFHNDHPEREGLELTELRDLLETTGCRGDLTKVVVDELCHGDFSTRGAVIRRDTHQATLSDRLQPAADRLHDALRATPLDPPALKELLTDSESRQALRFLLESGSAIQVGSDLVMDAAGHEHLMEEVRGFLSIHGPATISQIRQAAESSRRIMVPFLEKLDGDGITLRDGDKRRLRK